MADYSKKRRITRIYLNQAVNYNIFGLTVGVIFVSDITDNKKCMMVVHEPGG